MNKQGAEFDLGDLIRAVEERTDGTDLEIKHIIKTAFELLAEALADERRVELHDVGVFSLQRRKARLYKFGDQEIEKPEHDKIRFKASPAFADVIWNTTGIFAD